MQIELSKLFFCEKEHVAFSDANRTVLFSEFKSDVRKHASFLKQIPEHKIALFIQDNMYLFSVLFFALIQANKHVVLPSTKKQIAHTSYFKEIPLVSDNDFPVGEFNLIHIPEALTVSDFEFHSMGNEKISFFTSGSTSAPKEITKSIRTLFAGANNIYNHQKHLLGDNETTLIATIQPFHMYGMLWRMLFPLTSGLPIDLDLVMSPEDLQERQTRYKKLFFLSVPSFMDRLVKYTDLYDFSKGNIKEIISTGSLLSKEISDGITKIFGVCPFEVFGSTETGGVAWRQQCNGNQWTVFPPVTVEKDADDCLKVSSEFIEGGYFKMSDAVHMEGDDNRHFILLGRRDRLVKIAEKRVSLPEMEARYESHEFVQQACVVSLSQEKLGALLVLTEEGKAFLKSHLIAEFKELMHRYMIAFFDNSAIPRKLKFSIEIPKNSQGKILKDDVISILESQITEPIVENIKFSKDIFTADLTFLKDSTYFQGHFPNIPILPGVVQLHFVAYFIKKFWLIDVSSCSLKRIKFSKIIFPNSSVKLSIYRKEDGFTYSFGENFSSGIFVVDKGK